MKVLRVAVLSLVSALVVLGGSGCDDNYRPVANPVISPGGQPQSTYNAWVVNYNPSGDGSTMQIDVSGDTNLATTSMGVGSLAEAFPANSLALFVANSGNDTVSEFLPTLGGAITTISLLPGSHPILLNSATNSQMYVLNSGSNSACPDTGSISVISTSSLTVSSTTCVGHNPTAMVQSTSSGYIYIVNQGDGNVTVFNPATAAVIATMTTDPNPVAVAASPDTDWIFTLTQGDGVHPGKLDITFNGQTFVTASVPLGVLPTYAVGDLTRNRLYVTNSGDNTVSVFDTSNIKPTNNPAIPTLATVPVGTKPIGVTPLTDGSRFYVANATSNDVTVVSANSFSPLTSVPLPSGANPVWIASDPSASKVYVADQGTSEVTIIQTSNNTVTQNIAGPPQNPSCSSSCALQTPVMILTN